MNFQPDISRFYDRLLGFFAVLAGLILIAIMLMICTKIFLRYILGIGWIGVDQLSGTLLLYMTFLGAAWVLNREEHVTIDFAITRLSPLMQAAVLAVNSAICAIFCFIVFVYGTIEVIESFSKGIRVAAELEFPRAINLVVIPVGCLLLWIQFLRRAWRAHRTTVHVSRTD